VSRTKDNHSIRSSYHHHGDAGDGLWYLHLPHDTKATYQGAYNVAWCMFAFHYFCDSETHCRNLFASAAHLLQTNGKFSLTFPNPFLIFERLHEERDEFQREKNEMKDDPICSIRYHSMSSQGESQDNSDPLSTLFSATLDDCLNQFGIKYYFSLGDAVENCPEYIVPIKRVLDIAMEYDLYLYQDCPSPNHTGGGTGDGGDVRSYSLRTMGEWIERQCLVKEEFLALRGPMQVCGPKSPGRNVSGEEWAAIDLYLCLTFVKRAVTS
jgi:hypothetical protein